VDIGINALKAVRALIASTERADLPRYIKAQLLPELRSAYRAFAEHRDKEGREILGRYVTHLK
jgi:uncharacterized protein YicC (UPF0701 family)